MEHVRFYGQEPYRAAVLHGGPGAPGSVAAIARELSKQCGVLEPIQTETSLEGQINECSGVLSRYASGPIVLIGHSWGAWLAYLVAARHPRLVQKLILVGSGPFEEKYVESLANNRMSRLNEKEQVEFHSLVGRLNDPEAEDKDQMLARLGTLAAKSDDYDPVVIKSEELDRIPADGIVFQSVWNDAAILRQTGLLLSNANYVECPVIAIHGDYDPHPAEGVREPLDKALTDFQFYLIKRCGHSPWKEKYAMDDFYTILKREIM